ncbi:hypothetical protein CAC42_3740 [Sphaceloma murrayae]|uniref:Uncharacterized protein n=1 Tax=Sphaceloma murrayae TaxID=2082308 RepID=A0A2K1QH22_9PEZI|nr:hypothetical protein CAC42_3740 [Sphaceloma murrayae]
MADTTTRASASMIPAGEGNALANTFIEMAILKEACNLLTTRLHRRAEIVHPEVQRHRRMALRYQQHLRKQEVYDFWGLRRTEWLLYWLDENLGVIDSQFARILRQRKVLERRIKELRDPAWSDDQVEVGLEAARTLIMRVDWLVSEIWRVRAQRQVVQLREGKGPDSGGKGAR